MNKGCALPQVYVSVCVQLCVWFCVYVSVGVVFVMRVAGNRHAQCCIMHQIGMKTWTGDRLEQRKCQRTDRGLAEVNSLLPHPLDLVSLYKILIECTVNKLLYLRIRCILN